MPRDLRISAGQYGCCSSAIVSLDRAEWQIRLHHVPIYLLLTNCSPFSMFFFNLHHQRKPVDYSLDCFFLLCRKHGKRRSDLLRQASLQQLLLLA